MPTPKVDDQFWFDRSADAVTMAPTRINEAAGKVATALVWLWGIYTATVSIGITLPAKTAGLPTFTVILLILPVPLLLFAYVCAVWAQIPRHASFEPNAPLTIQREFSRDMSGRRTRLGVALALAGASAVLVSIAIMTASAVRPPPTPPMMPSLRAVLLPSETGPAAVAFTGSFPPATTVTFRLVPIAGSDWDKSKEVTKLSLISTDTGIIQSEVRCVEGVKAVDVVAEWSQDGSRRGLLIPAVK